MNQTSRKHDLEERTARFDEPVVKLHHFFIENLLSRFAGSGEARKIGNWKLKIGIIALLFFIWCDYASAFTITTPTKNKVGLVGHWTFDGADMVPNVRDKSGQGNHGTISGMSTTGTTTVRGKLGQGLQFDGVDDYVQTNYLISNYPLTLCAWIKPEHKAGDTLYDVFGSIGAFLLVVDVGDTGFQFYDNSDGTLNHPAYVVFNQWQHVCAVIGANGSNSYMYVNGIGEGPGDFTNIDYPGYGFLMGGASGPDFKGSLDDVRIYNRALSASEIQALYKTGEGTKVSATPKGIAAVSGCTSGLSCGLVGHWTFDGQDMLTGTVRDVSGNNNHGSMVNMATATSRTKGKVGQALKFDGVDDRINILHSASISPSEITIAFWMFPPTDFLAGKRIIDKGVTEYLVRRVAPGNGNKIEFFPGGYTSQNAVLQGRWTHVTITASASGHRMYLNGNLDFSNAIAYSPSGTGPLRIGGSTDFFPGDLDDVRIYNRVLSPSEIQALYKMGEGTKTATTPSAGRGQAPSGCTSGLSCGLVGHWTFDGADMVPNVRDKSGQGNHGTISGMSTTGTTTVRGKLGQALQFDGVDDEVLVSQSLYSDVTLSIWVKPNTVLGDHSIVDASVGIFSYFQQEGSSLRLYDGGSYWYNIFVAGKWNHLVATFKNNTKQYDVYNNGVLIHTSANGGYSSGGIREIGHGDLGYFNGTIDDVRIYNRALSVQEIQQLYNMGR